MGGAFAALAEGADGQAFNAAAPAVRPMHSSATRDYDLSVGATFPSGLRGTDFDNNGKIGFTYDNFVFVTVGAVVQDGPLAIGMTLDSSFYDLGPLPGVADLESVAIQIHKLRILGAGLALDEELAVGAGPRGVLLAITGNEPGRPTRDLATQTGYGVELGALYMPRKLPMRLGLTFRSPITGKLDPSTRLDPDQFGSRRIGHVLLPDRIVLPWEVEWGVAVQFGPRPLNLGRPRASALDADEVLAAQRSDETYEETRKRLLRDAYDRIPRRKLLLAMSFVATGPVSDAVGVESFLSQTVDHAGEKTTLSGRLGLEAEPVRGFNPRLGTYVEPSRFRNGDPRVHGTTGFDVRLFESSVFGLYDPGTSWRVGGSIDLARDYLSWGVSFGVWR